MSNTVVELAEEDVCPAYPHDPADAAVNIPATRTQSGFYGWVILPLAIAMMLATSPGQTFGVSYFNERFLAEFGISNTLLSAIYMVATLCAASSLTYIGSLIDRYGTRRVALIGLAAMSGACVFAAQAQGPMTLFLALLSLRMFGPGMMTLLANNALASWFDSRLGLVTSISQVIMAVAFALIPVAIVESFATVGWRGTYLVFAAVMALVFLPLVAVFFCQSPQELGQVPDGLLKRSASQRTPFSYGNELTLAEASRQHSYWILLISVGMWALVGTGLVFHLVTIFQTHGLAAEDSTKAVTAVAIAMGLTQVVGGLLADYMAMRWLLLVAMTLIGASCVMIVYAGQLSTLVLAYGVYGCGQGLMSIISGTAWPRFFGRTQLGKIRGTSLTAAIASSAVGPVIMGASSDYLGSFTPSLWLFVAIAASCAAAGYWATPPRTALATADVDESILADAA